MSKLLKKLSPLFFEVNKVKASDYAPGLKFSSGMDHLIIATQDDGNKIAVNACSKGYHLISNRELMTPLIEKMEERYKNVDVKIIQFGHCKFYTDFIIKDLEMEVIKGDPIFGKVRMNNSYDGSVKYAFNFGFHRLVCKNGLTAPIEGMSKDIKAMHTPNTGAKATQDTMDAISVFLDEAPEIIKGYKGMLHKIKWEDALAKIEEIASATKFPKKQKETAAERLTIEMNMGLPLNNFLVYNAMNYALYQGDKTAMKEHKKDKVDLQILQKLS